TVWHVNGAGYLTGLSLLLDPELDEYFSWPFSFRGLQVLVHAPYNYPDVTARGVIIGSDREAFMQISAESTYTSDNLRHLSPHDRKCFLKEENSPNKSLGGTQYSYRNCMVQCRLQHMIKLCQCAPFNYHFFKSSKTCGLADIECLSRY
ncbi:Sodium channel protein Nach, partial [Gryllus bimaculatus]